MACVFGPVPYTPKDSKQKEKEAARPLPDSPEANQAKSRPRQRTSGSWVRASEYPRIPKTTTKPPKPRCSGRVPKQVTSNIIAPFERDHLRSSDRAQRLEIDALSAVAQVQTAMLKPVAKSLVRMAPLHSAGLRNTGDDQ